jgi:hypothetical protein
VRSLVLCGQREVRRKGRVTIVDGDATNTRFGKGMDGERLPAWLRNGRRRRRHAKRCSERREGAAHIARGFCREMPRRIVPIAGHVREPMKHTSRLREKQQRCEAPEDCRQHVTPSGRRMAERADV